jgi:ArsR family transcriptional regulator
MSAAAAKRTRRRAPETGSSRRKGSHRGTASGAGGNGDAAVPPDWNRVARTLKAVAHPLRLRIIDLLEGGERSVGDIVDALGAKPAVTSQQLGLMRDRGVLEARREGTHVYYRIANRHVVNVIHCIRRSCRASESES